MENKISEKIIEEFLEKTTIVDVNNPKQKEAVVEIMEFLLSEKSVNSMIVCSKLGLPAMTGIVCTLEEKYAKNQEFPFYIEETENFYTNRQNIGRMIKFVMQRFGYIPKESYMSERKRLSKFANSKYFSTAAIYIEDEEVAEFELEISIKEKKGRVFIS